MSKKNLQDLEFVLGEIVNRQRAFAEGGKPEVRDAFCTISHPSGRGSLIVGRAGFEAMDRLAEVAARAAGVQKRVKLTDVRTNIGKLISERFLGEGQEPSDKTVAKMLNEAGRRAKATLGKRTYLIPCHLSTRTEPDPIVLGPVRFVGTAGAHGRIRKAFFRLRAESEHYRRDRSWMLQALRHVPERLAKGIGRRKTTNQPFSVAVSEVSELVGHEPCDFVLRPRGRSIVAGGHGRRKRSRAPRGR